MRRPLLVTLPLALATAALWPSAGWAAPSTTQVELVGRSTLAPASAPQRFTLVGVHWLGDGRVLFRTRSLGSGRWSPWRPAAPEAEDAPDAGTPEARAHKGWHVGNPWWVGPSNRIEARTVGRVTRVRAHLVWSPVLRVPFRAPAATLAADRPAIVPRASWGANEGMRRNAPVYAPSLRFAIVHHTAGRNAYTRAEAPAIVRGIQLYHVQSNGWNDIGYNFLVDRFGTIYEGRYGGIDRNVVGAHARGFNTGSVGIALLGTYGDTAPSKAAEDAIARLIAWRLDLAHVDPTRLLTIVSGGSERFASGIPVPLRAVSGHRDTGATACPGDALYARLGTLAANARRIGLPKIFEPRVSDEDVGYRFTARLSSSAPWAVVVTSAAGGEVARGTGDGAAVDWTWDTSAVTAGTYRWRIESGSARPATGTIAAAGEVTLAVLDTAVAPTGITPNGDGQADAATIAYRLTAPANVTVTVLDASGAVVATVVDRVWTKAGERTTVVDGAGLSDGAYTVVITARRADGAEASSTARLVVSRTLGTVSLLPTLFSPNDDGVKDRVTVMFSLSQPATARVRVVRADGSGVASLLAASLPAGRQRIVWTGVRASGPIRDGTYAVVVEAQDAVGRVAFSVPITADTRAPRVRFVPGRRVRIEVDEPAVLRLRVGHAHLRREVARGGVVTIPNVPADRRVTVFAVDPAGNRSPTVVRSAAAGQARSGK